MPGNDEARRVAPKHPGNDGAGPSEIPGGRITWLKSIREKVLEPSRSGMKASEIAEATGLTYFTVHGWKKRAPAFRLVPISKEIATVTTKSGLKIAGLSFTQAAELAERL